MAIIKCKMCGGDLNLIDGASTAECEFCGSVQTIPNLDDEKKLIQFERAERLRKQCEFDKAAGIYETIVADFRQEAEAYWGLVLCKYGIEYVDDPASGKKIPTCHRSSFESIMEDSDFEQALENADGKARRVYREEAKAIEEIRKGIIAVSSNEQPYDIFICYKETDENGDRTLDSVLAQDVYDALKSKGYRVFFSRITLEDKLGVEYEPYIFAALNSAKIMLTFGTDYEYFNAVWVKNEWSRFLKLMAKDKSKHLIPCYKGIDAYDMPKEFARLQAQDLGKVGAMQDLLRGIEKVLPPKEDVTKKIAKMQQMSVDNPTVDSYLKRATMALEDGEWSNADKYCEQVLNIDPENTQAYLIKLLSEMKITKLEQLANAMLFTEDNNNYKKLLRFADETLKRTLAEYIESAKEAASFRRENGVLVKYRGEQTDVCIPGNVTSIGVRAFEYCTALTSVVIPDSVTSIGDHAFLGCKALTSVIIPDSVLSIGERAFAGCEALISAVIPNSVTSIGEYAFGYCEALTTVVIPDSVLSIGKGAFANCTALTSVVIPDGVTSICSSAFSFCKALTSMTIPDGVTSIGNFAFGGCEALTSVVIPDSVTSIGENVFSGCEALTSVVIPDSVTSIGEGAFEGCTVLTSVVIPDSITSIGKRTFFCCDELALVIVPDSVTHIDEEAFLDSKKCTISTSLGSYAWEWAKSCGQKVKENEHSRKRSTERRAAGLCQYCGGQLKGLFGKKCVSCGKPKDY